MTLDGVVENPSWSAPFWNDEIEAFKQEETDRTDALLLGRMTYEQFAQAWPTSPDPGAAFFNSVKKYVVSTTLTDDIWENATFIGDDVRETIIDLKEQGGGDLAVHGSISLTKWLLEEGLIDELRLLVYPVVEGSGRRLLDDVPQAEFVLDSCDAISDGVLALVYRPKSEHESARSKD
jgi:dihydrofolate reductase